MTAAIDVTKVMLANSGKARICTMTQQEIADACCVSKNTVYTILSRARDLGLIVVSGTGTGTVYHLKFNKPVEIQSTHSDTWTDAKVERLLALREKGLSRHACAKAMGITRNAVVGKLTRLKKEQADAISKQSTTTLDAGHSTRQHQARQGQARHEDSTGLC